MRRGHEKLLKFDTNRYIYCTLSWGIYLGKISNDCYKYSTADAVRTHTPSSAGRPVVATECRSMEEAKSDVFVTLVFNYLHVLFHLPFLVQKVKVWQQVCTIHVICLARSSHEHRFNLVIWPFRHVTSPLLYFCWLFCGLIRNAECLTVNLLQD